MRIKVINPNTTESMTRTIGEAAARAASLGTEIVAVSPMMGPVSIESDAFRVIVDECRRALTEDRSSVIVLGCAGMADLCERISLEIGAPVIDGVRAAVKLVETLVSLNLGTSKRGDLAYPPPKPYTGVMQAFAPVSPWSGSTEPNPI
jgi:Asp/Glu/hydantoin racemase